MKKGIISVYVLIFCGIFLLILAGLLGFILMEMKVSEKKLAFNQAFEIAEAGINYYRWCLNNQALSNCQTEKDYQDSNGNFIGKFSISTEPLKECGRLTSIKVSSTGWTFKYPEIKRKISVVYSTESVAKYSLILNSDVWVGEDQIIYGPYHSNGGIRFDGKNLSTVSSAKSEWICTRSFGCGSEGVGHGYGLCPPQCKLEKPNCICPGVFSTTQNSNQTLFSFPVANFDFDTIAVDLNQLKSKAQEIGIYLPPSKNLNPQAKGYHLIFKEDGKVEVKIITKLLPTCGYSFEDDGFPLCQTTFEGYWEWNYFTISSEYTYRVYEIPQCPLIFVEDNLWPEGKIKGKVVLASANLIDPNKPTDVILQYNIDYANLDGSCALTLISQRNILIGPDSPNEMILRGIFIAQKGRFSRNHYLHNIKESLKIFGSIVSNKRVGTQWVISSSGQIVSGYKKREIYIDQNLIYQPPVFTPVLSPEFKIIKWEEVK